MNTCKKKCKAIQGYISLGHIPSAQYMNIKVLNIKLTWAH